MANNIKKAKHQVWIEKTEMEKKAWKVEEEKRLLQRSIDVMIYNTLIINHGFYWV